MFSVVELPVFSKKRVHLSVLQVNEREVNFLLMDLILATLLSAHRGQVGAGWGGLTDGTRSLPSARLRSDKVQVGPLDTPRNRGPWEGRRLEHVGAEVEAAG